MTTSKKTKCRCWFFTWNNPPVEAIEQLKIEFSKLDYVFQLEIGDLGTKHLQGVVRYKNPRNTYPLDYDGIHWERSRNWRKAIKYCSKLNTRLSGPYTNVTSLKFRVTLRDPLRDVTLYPWQLELSSIVRKTPEFRRIYWIWSQNGCKGKTSFARHLKILYGDRIMYVNGASRDILCVLAKRLEECVEVQAIFFGLTRQDANHMSYKTLEIFSDGIGFSGKYESSDIIFNPPHVIVLANFPPQLEMCSADRWSVLNVGQTRSPTAHATS